MWRSKGGNLILREHVRRHYPRAVLALEALRRTLTPVVPRRERERDPDFSLAEAPAWVWDALQGDSGTPQERSAAEEMAAQTGEK